MDARLRMELATGAMFRGSSSDRLRADWSLGNIGKDTTPLAAELATLRQRSRDLNRSHPIASGATETMGINIVGSGLKPQSQLRAERLDLSPEEADYLRSQAEDAFEEFAKTADAGNRLSFDELQFLALRKIVEDGEIIAIPTWAKEPWRIYGRCIELIEADRLGGYTAGVRGLNDTGIDVGSRGQPVKYWIQKADYGNPFSDKYEYAGYPARDAVGRPNVLHLFATKRAGQLRGWPLFAPVLTYFKDLSDYLEAEVVAARVAACLAVFVTKQNPLEAAWMSQTDTESTSGAKLQGLEPGMVNYLGVGEGINVVDPKRPGDAFAPFVEGVMRIIGASINMPYELLLKDFSKTNYSSARAALLEGRRMFMNWRTWFADKFCQPIWELVLEEAYLRRRFDCPDFYQHKSELCRCLWVGGSWGWVDPTKEVEAAKAAIDYGLSTLAEECAGQGRDWEEVLAQRAKEEERARSLGLTMGARNSAPPAAEPQTPNPEAP
jgi:lambda family phage portal protein